MERHRILVPAIACLGLAAPWAAHAQTASNGDTVTAVDAVIVTAQRRAERLVDVPASVSVVSGEQLGSSGVGNSFDLRLVTPNFNITNQGVFAQPTVRGIGTTVVGPGADPSVSMYVDGVYQAAQQSALLDFADIQSIQVLKGPQGALYGRNATGGAVVITTRAPKLHELSGHGEVSYGSFAEIIGRAFVNVPLGDQWAANLSAYERKNHGYTTNVATGRRTSKTDTFAIRGRLLFQPTDSAKFILTGSNTNSFDNTAYSYAPYRGVGPAGTVATALNNPRLISLSYDPVGRLVQDNVSLNAEFTGAWGTLTSITSWAIVKPPFRTDIDGSELPLQDFRAFGVKETTKTQEFIYTSPSTGPFRWIGGLFAYRDSNLGGSQVCVGAAGVCGLQSATNEYTTAYAAYAEGTYDLTEALHLTVGGRYSYEKKHATNAATAGAPLRLDAEKNFYAFTPHAALRYSLSDYSSAYASYSRGFKSGLFDSGNTSGCTTAPLVCPSRGTPVQPEKVTAYEVGYKYNHRGVVASVSAYYNDQKNLQINGYNAANTTMLFNVPGAHIYGVEAEFSKEFNNSLSIRSGGAYTHGRYTSLPNGINYIPRSQYVTPPASCPAANVNCQFQADDSGHTTIRTPTWTAYVSGVYTHPLDEGRVDAALTVSYSSSFYWAVDNRVRQPSFTVVNANLTWYAPGDHWFVRGFANNLLDEKMMNFVREAPVGDFVSFRKPRTYGVALGVNF